jgi:hypothetical protein
LKSSFDFPLFGVVIFAIEPVLSKGWHLASSYTAFAQVISVFDGW